MNSVLPRRFEVLDGVLNRVHPPVARFRIVSGGLAPNHTLKTDEDLSGTRACLACGNCVDACPVVASKSVGTMFVRTSMLLEHVVGEECRRCFRCVASCPQVSRPLKDYVRGYRRIERLSHWDLLVSYLVLMTSGILVNHWGQDLPADLRTWAGLLHRLFAVFLIAAPIVWVLFDRHHFLLAARRALSRSGKELGWLADTASWIGSWGRRGAIRRGAFNPGQKFWYLFVPVALALFALSGTLRWLGPGVVGQGAFDAATAVHITIAWTTDILLLLHIWLKLALPVLRDMVRGIRQHLDIRHCRQALPLRGK